MGKSTISMVIFNSYVKLPEGTGIDYYRPYRLTTCFFVHVQQTAQIRRNSFLPTDTIPSKQRRNNIGNQFPKPSNLYGALSYQPLPLQELFAHCITPNVNPGLINP